MKALARTANSAENALYGSASNNGNGVDHSS